jgi:PAS domain S-box-containing protein
LKPIIQDKSNDEDNIISHLKLISLTGLSVSLFLLAYKQIFRPDIQNLIADIATVLIFAGATISSLNKRISITLNLVFLIPILIYFYYLSGFSNSDSPSETIYLSLVWFISGIVVLAGYSKINARYYLFVAVSATTMVYHISEAEMLDDFTKISQTWIYNPVLILLLSSLAALSIRTRSDNRYQKIMARQTERERQNNETFQAIRHPIAQIHAERDQEGNAVRLEVEKVNRAFESQFRISLQEIKGQELNYIFRYIFRNDTDWNDLFIISQNPRNEIYSAHLDKWYSLQVYWFGKDTCSAVFHDISREKKEIRKLEEARDRYIALLEAIPDIFFIIDRDGTYEDIVFKGQADLHREAGEVIGSTIFDVGFPDNMANKIFECIRRAIENDSIETIEYALNIHDATLLFEMRLVRLNENSVVSIARDITRRKKAEFELERAKTKAEEAVLLKSRFLANLSHDIRTPVSIIMGLSKMLGEPGLSMYEKEEFIVEISKNGDQLLRMIDNTIHLSKIETNTMEINSTWCNIHHLLKEIYTHFYSRLPENRNITIKMYTGILNGDVGFETDAELLKDVFHELIDNAVRFTEDGQITFGYDTGNAGKVEFFVEDSGPGIPEDEKENVFLRFYVIERDRQTGKAGPGIGLPVAQHFVALLGGELQLKTNPGKGSRFWFELPLVNPRGFMRRV